MEKDTLLGVEIVAASLIMLIAGFNGNLYIFSFAMLGYFLIVILKAFNTRRGLGPFKVPLVVTFVLLSVGYIITISQRDVTGVYSLGFTPSAAAAIYLVWICPFILDVAYGVYFDHILTKKEWEVYLEEVEEEKKLKGAQGSKEVI